jgi:hypothetical protein
MIFFTPPLQGRGLCRLNPRLPFSIDIPHTNPSLEGEGLRTGAL